MEAVEVVEVVEAVKSAAPVSRQTTERLLMLAAARCRVPSILTLIWCCQPRRFCSVAGSRRDFACESRS